MDIILRCAFSYNEQVHRCRCQTRASDKQEQVPNKSSCQEHVPNKSRCQEHVPNKSRCQEQVPNKSRYKSMCLTRAGANTRAGAKLKGILVLLCM